MSRAHLIGATLVLAMVAPAEQEIHANGSSANVVFEWNQIPAGQPFPVPHNPLTPRFFAMTHIAMFDAINAIEREFEPYRVRVHSWATAHPTPRPPRPPTTSWSPSIRAPRQSTMRRSRGSSAIVPRFVRWGAAVGAKVAREILEWRQNDGWVVSPFPPYSEPPVPGRWQPTPPTNAAAAFTHLQKAAPMALSDGDAVPAAAAANLQNARYATDLNEVKLIGESNSATRTAEQTAIARVWAGIATTGSGTSTNFLSIWNNVVRDVARERRLSLVETARRLRARERLRARYSADGRSRASSSMVCGVR